MAVLLIHRKPSCWLAAILWVIHFAVAALLWPLALPFSVKTIAVIVLIISLIYYLRRDALLTASTAVATVELSEEKQCMLITRSGELIIGSLLGSTFVSPYLTVLDLKPAGRWFARSIVILPDSIEVEEFRQLRIWLRWKWRGIDIG